MVDLASRNDVKKKFQNMYSISKVSRVDEYKIIELYKSGKSSTEISKIYGYKTRESILNKLKKFNIERRSSNELRIENKSYYNFSMRFINSYEKAYFLGLLLTDGSVNDKRGSITLDLTDKDAIEMLARYINIKFKEFSPGSKGKLNRYRITFYGKDYVKQVERFGVISNKTHILTKPLLNEQELIYLNYIIRGIIDGDGWIRKDGKEFFISSASFEFIKWCKEMLEYMGLNNLKIKFIKNNYNGIYLIRTASRDNIELLKLKIYDKPFGMMRKYERLHGKDVQRL
ncbi:LAGLIDADG family homing endonuclease [Clostridium sp. UBA6640]|uniref:LAGLIDADG family homing endonuclease n=1 Tax=Clostridium sp. UBA6640 TaxID=1946370 RepID=UPI0025B86E70|nr:LAGLIDADG family homing endonuclease [Clostridium sp. UBA6640]